MVILCCYKWDGRFDVHFYLFLPSKFVSGEVGCWQWVKGFKGWGFRHGNGDGGGMLVEVQVVRDLNVGGAVDGGAGWWLGFWRCLGTGGGLVWCI